MNVAEVFSLAHALGTVNRHPDPEQYAQDVADAYTPPEDAAPAPITLAAEPEDATITPV